MLHRHFVIITVRYLHLCGVSNSYYHICLCTVDQILPRLETPSEALLMQQNNILFEENRASSQNEQTLYVAWKNSVQEHKNINSLIV